MDRVPFTEEAVKNYLDDCIRRWRKMRDLYRLDWATYYVDAFQSVRISLFGEALPADSEDDYDER